ncbi:MAG TPA: hypothetical protein HPP56_00980 [Nitrospirae bacterium]|nr:hypothetical protein [Nitrospirota bacterium]
MICPPFLEQDKYRKVSYKNPSQALPILLADLIKLFSSIDDLGQTQSS